MVDRFLRRLVSFHEPLHQEDKHSRNDVKGVATDLEPDDLFLEAPVRLFDLFYSNVFSDELIILDMRDDRQPGQLIRDLEPEDEQVRQQAEKHKRDGLVTKHLNANYHENVKESLQYVRAALDEPEYIPVVLP